MDVAECKICGDVFNINHKNNTICFKGKCRQDAIDLAKEFRKQKAKGKVIKRRCKRCNTLFVLNQFNELYCRKAICRRKRLSIHKDTFKKLHVKKSICKICGKEFKPSSKFRKYCGIKCQTSTAAQNAASIKQRTNAIELGLRANWPLILHGLMEDIPQIPVSLNSGNVFPFLNLLYIPGSVYNVCSFIDVRFNNFDFQDVVVYNGIFSNLVLYIKKRKLIYLDNKLVLNKNFVIICSESKHNRLTVFYKGMSLIDYRQPLETVIYKTMTNVGEPIIKSPIINFYNLSK